MYNRTIMSGIANGLERQSLFSRLLRIARVSPSELCSMTDAQGSTKHMAMTFSGD
jgi:hypothetical protein